jgi:hypothetical protein
LQRAAIRRIRQRRSEIELSTAARNPTHRICGEKIAA